MSTTPPDGRYVRVYYSVLTDRKFREVYDDDARFATWVRLLLDADAAWPLPAPIPAKVDPQVLAFLKRVRLVDLVGTGHFRVHGLDAERGRRSESARIAGRASQQARREGSETPPNNGRSTGAQRSLNGRSTAVERRSTRTRHRLDLSVQPNVTRDDVVDTSSLATSPSTTLRSAQDIVNDPTVPSEVRAGAQAWLDGYGLKPQRQGRKQ